MSGPRFLPEQGEVQFLRSLLPRLAGLGDDRFPMTMGPCSALDQALLLRLAAAFRTPSNWPQPPELAGVDGSVRVPNSLQPMSGEFSQGHEVNEGGPAFFAPAHLAALPLPPRRRNAGF